MPAEVADIADLDGQIIARLPLDVQRVVDAVGKLVVAIVEGEREKRRAINDLGRGGKVIEDVRGIAGGRRLQLAAPRGVKRTVRG